MMVVVMVVGLGTYLDGVVAMCVVVVVVVVVDGGEGGLRVVGWGCVSLFHACAAGIIYLPKYTYYLCPVSSAGYCILI